MDIKTQPDKISRRDFLKRTAVMGAGLALTSLPKKVTAGKTPGTHRRMAMVIDLRRCFGCNACSVACKAQFDVPLGVWRSWVITTENGTYPRVSRKFLPVLCNHCENAPCLKGCPSKAIIRDDNGIVLQKEDRCIGCKYCIQNCPYEVRFSHPVKKVAQKCNFCFERIEQGLEPACVNTCNAKARVFGDLNDPDSGISKLIAQNPVKVLLPEQGTRPKVFYIGLDEGVYKKQSALFRHA